MSFEFESNDFTPPPDDRLLADPIGLCHGNDVMGFFDFFSDKKESGRPRRSVVNFPEDVLRELVFSIEEKEVPLLASDVSQKKVLEIAPSLKSLDNLLQDKGANVVRLGGAKEKDLGQSGKFVFSHWENISLLPGSQDLVVLRTSFLKTSSTRLLKELVRVLSPQGRVIFSEFHPFSPLARSGGEPVGFERYWKSFEETGLKLSSVREVFFDGTMKKVIPKGSESLRNNPILILFTLKK